MAETTSKNLENAKRKDLPRQAPDFSVVTGSRVPGGLQDTEFQNSDQEDWSKEFDR